MLLTVAGNLRSTTPLKMSGKLVTDFIQSIVDQLSGAKYFSGSKNTGSFSMKLGKLKENSIGRSARILPGVRNPKPPPPQEHVRVCRPSPA
uniref:Uncharacterized protein n=1 Tax=Romanomermis culicivorax TaxID=13658 RepID=A0A915LC89_ROMCU